MEKIQQAHLFIKDDSNKGTTRTAQQAIGHTSKQHQLVTVSHRMWDIGQAQYSPDVKQASLSLIQFGLVVGLQLMTLGLAALITRPFSSRRLFMYHGSQILMEVVGHPAFQADDLDSTP